MRITLNLFMCPLLTILALFSAVPSHGENPVNEALTKQVAQLGQTGNYSAIQNLMNAEESNWKTSPQMSYFRNMASIAIELVTGGSNAQLYWLGRKAVWNVLLKHAPNKDISPQMVRFYKENLLSIVEGVGPYVADLSPGWYASTRHDTYLMLSQYARQIYTQITPGYHNKAAWSGDPNRQDMIDNESQAQARLALDWLAENHENYLTLAYSHPPADYQELKMLLDILSANGTERDRIMRSSVDAKHYWPNFQSSPTPQPAR